METYKRDHIELHMLDINRLETVTAPEHVRENELAQMYRGNKYNLRMSSVPFELFLNYLQDNKYMLLLRIVNQYLNIQGKSSIIKSAALSHSSGSHPQQAVEICRRNGYGRLRGRHHRPRRSADRVLQ